jgi:hypothetical protein
MTTATAMRNAYAKESVTTASPAKLLTMLYDRLIRDLLTAEQAIGAGDAEKASEQLLHAQAIVLELQSSLKVDAWEGGPGLSAPTVHADFVDSGASEAVSMTIGTGTSSSARIRLSTSKPSRPGIMTSSTTQSGLIEVYSNHPASPSAAVLTV